MSEVKILLGNTGGLYIGEEKVTTPLIRFDYFSGKKGQKQV